MQTFIDFILHTVEAWGYWGLFLLMLMENSFIPLPSELIVVPAGYLAHQGSMNLAGVIFSALMGSLCGALINYYLALFVGRRFLYKYGKYFFISEKNLDKSEEFFRNHGAFSTFTGRLTPVIRQFIPIPAGLARMNIASFCFYTSLGAGIWVTILTLLGYFIGHNQALLEKYMPIIAFVLLVLIIVATVIYVFWHKKKAKKLQK
jgi:membrane protein DedA with SNARE-associated domain